MSKKVNFFKNKTYPKSPKPDKNRGYQQKTSLVESNFIKEKIGTILSKMEFVKDFHIREKSQLLEEFKYYQNWVLGMIDVMAIRIREEGKKNKFFEKEVKRLKQDINVLKQINQEFSLKLNSQNSISQLSYDVNSSKNYDSRFTQNDKENSRDLINTFSNGSHAKLATFGSKNLKGKFSKQMKTEGYDSYSRCNTSLQSDRMSKLKQRSKVLAKERRRRDMSNYYDKENFGFSELDLKKKYMRSECYEGQHRPVSSRVWCEEDTSRKVDRSGSQFDKKGTERGGRSRFPESRVLTERSLISDVSEDNFNERSQFVLTEKGYLNTTNGEISNKFEIHHIKFHTASISDNAQLKQIKETDSIGGSSIDDEL